MLDCGSELYGQIAAGNRLYPLLQAMEPLPPLKLPLSETSLTEHIHCLMDRFKEIETVLKGNSDLQETKLWKQLEHFALYERTLLTVEANKSNLSFEWFDHYYEAALIRDRLLRNYGIVCTHTIGESEQAAWEHLPERVIPKSLPDVLFTSERSTTPGRTWALSELKECEKLLERGCAVAIPRGRILFSPSLTEFRRSIDLTDSLYGVTLLNGEIEIYDPRNEDPKHLANTFIHELTHGIVNDDTPYLEYLFRRDDWHTVSKKVAEIKHLDAPIVTFEDGSKVRLGEAVFDPERDETRIAVLDRRIYRVMTYRRNHQLGAEQFPIGFDPNTLWTHIPVQLVLTRLFTPQCYSDSSSTWGNHIVTWIGTP